MKPNMILMAALLCAITLGSLAQTEKGKGFAGGGFSFSTSRESRSSSALNNFNFTPRIGYFLGTNFALGLEFPLSLAKLKGIRYTAWNREYGYYEDTYGPEEFSFGISPFARKYFELKKGFKIFAQANFLFQLSTTKIIDDDGYLADTDNRLKGIGASLSPGVAYFFNQKIGIEFYFPVINYFHQSYYDQYSAYNYSKTNNLKLALDNFTPNIGVNFHF